MGQMNVAMTLTLADAASGPLRAFTALMERLQSVATAASGRLEVFATSITGAAAAMSTAGAAGRSAASGIGAVSTRAHTAGVSTYALEQAMGALGGTLNGLISKLSGVTSKLGGVAAGFNGVGAAARQASHETGQSLVAQKGQADSLMTTLKGMAKIYAAMKIEHGLAASVKEASKFEQTETRLRSLNRPESENQEQLASARATSDKLKFVSVTDALEARMAAITGTAHTDPADIDKTINEALKVAIIGKMRGDKSDLKDIVRNLYGLAEMRGITANPEAMVKSFDFAQRVMSAADGKLTMKDMETVSRQVKYGAGAQINEEGWSQIFAFANQLKASGHGGGGGGGVSQAGTAVTQLVKWAEVGPKNKETVRLMSAMGLMDESKVSPDVNDTTMVNTREGAMTNSQRAIREPLQWASKILGPAMLKYVREHLAEYFMGSDPNDPTAQEKALGKLAIQLTAGQGGANVGNAIALAVLPGPSKRLADEATLTRNAKKTPEALADLDTTYQMQVTKFDAALQNLERTIGLRLLPLLTPLVEKVAEFIRWIGEFGENHPFITTIAAVAAGIAAVVMTITGFLAIAGLASIGTTALAAGFATMATAATAAGGWIVTALGAVVAFLGGPVTLIIVAVVAAWQFGFFDWLAKCEVFGRTLGSWATGLADTIVIAFQNMWARTKNFFGLVSDEATAAQIRANNAGSKANQKGGATGSWAEGGATGSWGDIQKPVGSTAAGTPTAAVAARRLGGGSAAGGGRSSNSSYNPGADLANNQLKRDEDQLRTSLQSMDALYKQGKLSILEHYETKQGILEMAVRAELSILDRERAAFKKAGNEAGVNRVDTKIEAVKNKLQTGSDKNETERVAAVTAAEKELLVVKKAAEQFEQYEAKASGERHQAELIRIRQRIEAEGAAGKIAPERIAVAVAKAQASSDYGYGMERVSVLQDEERRKEEAIALQVRNGAITQITADDLVYAERQKLAAQLDDLIAKLRVMAVASGDIKLQKAIGDLDQKNTGEKNTLSPFSAGFARSMTDAGSQGLGTLFASVLKGTESASKAIERFGQTLKNTFLDLISKKLGDALWQSLMGDGTKGGGLLPGLIGGAMKFFGIPGFATGINYVPNDMLAVIHEGEAVVPKRYNPAASGQPGNGGGSGGAVQLTIHPDAFHMRMGDWFEGEMSRQMANR